jgi:hypothetical protein
MSLSIAIHSSKLPKVELAGLIVVMILSMRKVADSGSKWKSEVQEACLNCIIERAQIDG